MSNTTWISWTIGATLALGAAFSVGACSNDAANGNMAGVVAGIDFGECFACGDMACPTQASSCDGAPGCRDLLNCAFSCELGDTACIQACVPANRAQELAQASSVYPGYLSCAITSCTTECSASSPTAGGGNAGAGAGTTTGIDYQACFACGDVACPSQAMTCDNAAGCRELLDCAFGCAVGDTACVQACVPANRAQELAQAASAFPGYVTCAVTSCADECSSSTATTGGGNAGAGAGTPGTLLLGGEMGNYVSATENTFGIQGSFFAYSDCDVNGDGVDDPASFSAFQCTSGWNLNTLNAGRACVSGIVGVREDMTNYLDWGAGFGLNLNEVMAAGATTGTAQPYDATANGVTGFSFEITGGGLPSNTVVEFPIPTTTGTGEEHNTRVRTGLNTVTFSSLTQATWVTTPQAFNASQILAMKWKIESTTAASNVDFCVTNIKPL